MSTTLSLQDDIVAALTEGFGGPDVVSTSTDGLDVLVHVADVADPIRVQPLDVIVPDVFGDIKASIRLDVAAVLASRSA